MNAAFGFGGVSPAAGSGVFALRHAGGAGLAADGEVAEGEERMGGDVVLAEVAGDVFGDPIGKWVEFGLFAILPGLEHGHVGAVGGLVAFAAGDAGAVFKDSAVERADFAEVAASVGVVAIERAVWVLISEFLNIGGEVDDVGEP